MPFVHPMTEGSGSPVHGEVWALNDAALADADELEGHPDWYARSPVGICLDGGGEVLEAELYFNKHVDDTDDSGLLHGFQEPAVRVRSGDFRAPLPAAAAVEPEREPPPRMCDDELLVVSYNLSFAVQKDWLFPVASEWWLVKEGREAHGGDQHDFESKAAGQRAFLAEWRISLCTRHAMEALSELRGPRGGPFDLIGLQECNQVQQK